MARLNIWGGATKDLLGFNATAGTSSISTSVTRNGSASFRANPTGSATGYADFRGLSAAGTPADFALASSFGRTYVRFDTGPASGSEECLVLIDGPSTRKLSVRVHSDGSLSLWDSTGTSQIGSNTAAGLVTFGNLHWYQIEWFAESGAGAGCDIRFEAGSVLSASGVSIGGNLTGALFGKVVNRNGNSVDFYYSDLAVDDAAWCDYGMVKALVPSDVGNYNAWTTGAGAGALWELVDENPNDGSTTYVVSTLNPGDAVTFALPSCASASIAGPIVATKYVGIARRHGAAASAWRARVRSGSTDDDGGTDFNTTGTFTHRARMQNAKPAGGSWSISDLDSAEIGGVERSATQQTRITSCHLEVECQPPFDVGARTFASAAAVAVLTAIASVGALARSSSAAQASPVALASVQARAFGECAARAQTTNLALVSAPALSGSTARATPTAIALAQARALAGETAQASPLALALSGAHARSAMRALASPTPLALVEARAFAPSLARAERSLLVDVGARSFSQSLARAGLATSAQVGFYESTANLVRTRASTLTLAPVFYDNQPDGTKPQDATWIGLAVEFEGTDQVLIGNQYRTQGAARFGVRVPATLGDRDALRIADEIRAAFTGAHEGATASFGEIIYAAPEIALGELDGGWWRMDVSVPFRRDRTQEPQASSGGFPSLEAVGNIARTRFKTLVADAHPCVTLWENQPGDIPTTSPWAHFSVRNDRIDIVGIGPPNRYRVRGAATAMLFASLTEGDKSLLVLADRIDIAFRAVTDQGVTFQTPEVQTIGLDQGWWRINVRVPFVSEFFVS